MEIENGVVIYKTLETINNQLEYSTIPCSIFRCTDTAFPTGPKSYYD